MKLLHEIVQQDCISHLVEFFELDYLQKNYQ